MACKKNQLEAVVYLVNAIFNGDTGHCLSFAVMNFRSLHARYRQWKANSSFSFPLPLARVS
ncbi:hypothetical protein GCM10007923_10770 [Shinella yambaruensis]|uniref:Transposase n=1 Tax=Shinella yambaruensis TaxID=415996 RepID=A0ABQ5ZDU0_9HYPH|nr:hypothetical protein GCM10007923_10770 [Shinella yambaruensis]